MADVSGTAPFERLRGLRPAQPALPDRALDAERQLRLQQLLPGVQQPEMGERVAAARLVGRHSLPRHRSRLLAQ